MKILVWHWGRRGAGPRFAAELHNALRGLAGIEAQLSLPETADIRALPEPPDCALPIPTYTSRIGLAWRVMHAPTLLARLDRALAEWRPDLAICAMPALLDPIMLRALRRRCIRAIIIAHDARPHPGDGGWARAAWDHAILRRADGIGVLSQHVVTALRMPTPILRLSHPPFPMPTSPPPLAHGGPLRVLSFGRMRAYKGLDLLADTLGLLPPEWECRVVGAGPTGAFSGTRVENRYVPEAELPALFAWADVLLLTHLAASQSGVAAMALGAGRFVVATDAGGLPEQLAGQPGAFLCPPDPAVLARTLRDLPVAPPVRVDAGAAWTAMAASLLAQARAAGLGRWA